MENKGYFITLEGIEGAGKSTVLGFISDYLKMQNIAHITTREPGGTIIAERIRQVLLAHDSEAMQKDTELLLMFAARAQHIANVILPALQTGKWVICDRFTDASYAYQGGGRGIALARIETLEKWVQGDLKPDLTLLLDIPVTLGLSRIKNRGDAVDRIEQEKVEFFERARKVYLERAHEKPGQYQIIDASCALPQLKNQIDKIISGFIQHEC